MSEPLPATAPLRRRYTKPKLGCHGRLAALTRAIGGLPGNTDNNPDMGANMKTEL